MLALQNAPSPEVRINLIWAAENIATTKPDVFKNRMDFFAAFLSDPEDKVRKGAPEIFRVMAKKCPESVQPFISKL